MNRRKFILTGSIGIAALSIPTAYYYFRDIKYDFLLAEPQSLSLIWDTETIISIGDQYCTQTNNENNEQALAKKIVADVPGSGEELKQNLNNKIKQDFQEHNTVLIDGWIISKTEARQCALLSTIQTKK